MTVACSCGGGSQANVQYEVQKPDGSVEIVATPGEARVIRASAGPATIVRQVPKDS